MKRQNSQLSSSSRRNNPPAEDSLRAKSIGCMSGILHLLSNYHNRHKIKSLTFGKSKSKPEKDIIVFSSSNSDRTPAADPNRRPRNDLKEGKRTAVVDLIRSPTLSAEIRRCSRSVKSTTIGKSPALVARLMGLEAEAPPAVAPATSEIKRRKLLGALEKCDNDLKALKDIIMAFRSPETPISGDGEKQRQHQNRVNRTLRGPGRQEIIQEKQLKKKKNPPTIIDQDHQDHTMISISASSFNPITKLQERITKLQQINKNTPQFEITKPPSTIMKAEIEKKKNKEENGDDPSPLTWRRSKAMAESLDEISNEISWGFKHEMAKIGLALQHHIYRDLIEEMVTDMAFSSALFHSSSSSLPPFEACRRRLRF